MALLTFVISKTFFLLNATAAAVVTLITLAMT